MGSIFKKAILVMAWLGPEQDNSTEVIEMIKQIGTEIKSCENVDVEILSRPAPQELLNSLNLDASDRSLLSLALPRQKDFGHLFSERPFWKRAWILPELVLAEYVVFICGRAKFSYLDLAEIVAWLSLLPASAMPADFDWGSWLSLRDACVTCLIEPMRSFRLVLTLDKVKRSHGPYIAAWNILTHAWPLAATDPRDKVYSMLGLLDIGFEADYSKSPETIYCEVATILTDRVPLDEWFRSTGICFTNRMPAIPTWVVDWDALSKLVCSASVTGDLYKADFGMLKLSKSTIINDQILTISGTLCYEIQILAPFSLDINTNAKEAFKFDLTGGLPEEEVLYTSIPPGIPRGQASLRLCIEDMNLSEYRRVMNTSFVDLAMAYCVLLQSGDAKGLAATYESDLDGFMDIFLGESMTSGIFDFENMGAGQSEMEYAYSQRMALAARFPKHFVADRHFYTKKGYLGYGNESLQKGDLICILQGCRVPVVLRKIGKYYRHVTTCFVLGLMDGEVAQLLQQGEVTIQEFDIH